MNTTIATQVTDLLTNSVETHGFIADGVVDVIDGPVDPHALVIVHDGFKADVVVAVLEGAGLVVTEPNEGAGFVVKAN